MNDELIVGNARTKETQNAFPIPVSTPTSSSMPSLSTEQQEMIQVISALSGRNFQLPQKWVLGVYRNGRELEGKGVDNENLQLVFKNNYLDDVLQKKSELTKNVY